MASTETTVINTKTGVGGAARSGANQLALIAPYDATATISANVVKKVRRSSDADTLFGAGSKLAAGAKAALGSNVPHVYMVQAAAKSGSPFTETRGTAGTGGATSTGTLPAANMPITSVTSVSRDGTALTTAQIKFTHLDPTGETVAASDILINPLTGKWKLGTATTGAGAGMVMIYQSHDWAKALDALDLFDYEIVAPANTPFEAVNYGVYATLLTEANTVDINKIVAGALPSGAVPSDYTLLVTAVQSAAVGRLSLLASKGYTGDLGSAWAAMVARSEVTATAKEQTAPAGVTYTDSYVRSDFGDEESPAAGTFHNYGVNAVFADKTGTYRVSNDRAVAGLTSFYRFKGTRRSQRLCETTIEDDILALRRGNDTAIPFTEGGLASIKNTILSSLAWLSNKGVIDNYNLVMPSLADISAGDRANRVLSGLEVSVRLTGQIHMVKLDLNIEV